MKIQSLAVLFIIIILPISIILTAYTSNQIKTLNLQTSYDSNLDNATYDALKAFQINTINNSTSDLSNSKIRDIEASINTFFNSIATNFNMIGYNQDILKEYVPALVYTMYDGYYIYSPFINTLPDEDAAKGENDYPDNTKITGLKPYIHYSMRYVDTGIDIVITYSLDNYITIQGMINGVGIHDSGYLIDNISNVNYTNKTLKYRGITIQGEATLQEYIGDNSNPNNLYNYVKVNGVKYYQYKPAIDGKTGWFTILNGEKYGGQSDLNGEANYNAFQYYADAYEFGKRLENYGIKNLKTSNIQIEEVAKKAEKFGNYTIFSGGSDSIEEPNSNFNQHRLAVIRYSIEKNLSIAIANYNNYVGQEKANFAMPELREDEWDKLLNNISIISFLQGLNIGGKVYNGYSIITNTKNKEVVAEDSIYITTSDGEYHNVKENGLNENENLTSGYLNIDFERISKLRDDGQTEYYYPRTQLGSYTSVITQMDISDTDNIYKYLSDKPNIAKIYYTALGRERYSMYRIKNQVEESEDNNYSVITNGLIRYYTGQSVYDNGTKWYDLSGNQDAEIYGATVSADGSVLFDGINDYAKAGYLDRDTIQNFTMEVKIKMNGEARYKHAVISNTFFSGIGLSIFADKSPSVFVWPDGVGVYTIVKADNTKIEQGIIYNISATYDGQRIKIYLNGELVETIVYVNGTIINSSGIVNGPISNSTEPLFIGCDPERGIPKENFVNANIYSVKIYNRALTQAEINQNINATK